MQRSGHGLDGGLLHGKHSLHQLEHPRPQARPKLCWISQQTVQQLSQRHQGQPQQDVRMQGPPALSLHLAAHSQDGATYAEIGGAACAAVREPILGPPPSPAAPKGHGIWTHAQDDLKEFADHNLEHEGLAYWVCRQPLRHLFVAGQQLLVLQSELVALHLEKQGLSVVGKVRRDEDQGRAEAEAIGDAFLLTELPVPIRPYDRSCGLVQGIQSRSHVARRVLAGEQARHRDLATLVLEDELLQGLGSDLCDFFRIAESTGRLQEGVHA